MSILSDRVDGSNFYYGFTPGDARQINVRLEDFTAHGGVKVPVWAYYVGGERIGHELSKGEAERAAIKWAKEHPG